MAVWWEWGGDRLRGLPRQFSQPPPSLGGGGGVEARATPVLDTSPQPRPRGDLLCCTPALCAAGLPRPTLVLQWPAWHLLGHWVPWCVSGLWATAAPASGSGLAAHPAGPVGRRPLRHWGPQSRARSVSIPNTSWRMWTASEWPGPALSPSPPTGLRHLTGPSGRSWGPAQQRRAVVFQPPDRALWHPGRGRQSQQLHSPGASTPGHLSVCGSVL